MERKNLLIDFAWITVSAICTAIAVNMFFRFTNLAPGGITGMCIIFSLMTHIPVDIMTLCISVPLLALGVIFLGKNFGIKTLYITFLTPLCMRLIPAIDVTAPLKGIPFAQLIVAAIVGGLLVGGSIGLALNRGCATGGTDLIALLVNHFISVFKVPKILLFLDGTVVVASGIISRDIMIAVFSFLSLLIIIRTISFFTEKNIGGPKNESIIN